VGRRVEYQELDLAPRIALILATHDAHRPLKRLAIEPQLAVQRELRQPRREPSRRDSTGLPSRDRKRWPSQYARTPSSFSLIHQPLQLGLVVPDVRQQDRRRGRLGSPRWPRRRPRCWPRAFAALAVAAEPSPPAPPSAPTRCQLDRRRRAASSNACRSVAPAAPTDCATPGSCTNTRRRCSSAHRVWPPIPASRTRHHQPDPSFAHPFARREVRRLAAPTGDQGSASLSCARSSPSPLRIPSLNASTARARGRDTEQRIRAPQHRPLLLADPSHRTRRPPPASAPRPAARPAAAARSAPAIAPSHRAPPPRRGRADHAAPPAARPGSGGSRRCGPPPSPPPGTAPPAAPSDGSSTCSKRQVTSSPRRRRTERPQPRLPQRPAAHKRVPARRHRHRDERDPAAQAGAPERPHQQLAQQEVAEG
jgi:hypothetical protein